MQKKRSHWQGEIPKFHVDDFLRRGQAIFLLDGIDEISSIDVRRALRASVFEGMERYPRCRWLMTSRIVGYDTAVFDVVYDDGECLYFAEEDRDDTYVTVRRLARRLYVAPFSDHQIERFASGWYATREHAEERASGGTDDLVTAIHKNPHTLRLARIPNLLTFMALIHRVLAQLPNGRALLYQEIAKAYLETIDTFRGLQEFDFPLHQKMRWLGNVAFQMQRQRESDKKDREVLVDRETVERWLSEEMRKELGVTASSTASTFLDYLARRSGLLLPRGQDVFAFAHLSFQEFFAAVYLMGQITSPAWLREKAAEGASREDVCRFGGLASWQETLILLFELLGTQPGWASEVYDCLFGEDPAPDDEERTALLAEIVADPHSALNGAERLEAAKTSWRVELTRQQCLDIKTSDKCRIPQILLESTTIPLKSVLFALKDVSCVVDIRQIWLSHVLLDSAQPETFFEALGAAVSKIRALDLIGTRVEDLSPLTNLSQLRTLYLGGTRVEDLSPLSNLSQLSRLYLSETRVEDLSPLSNLSQLSTLVLSGTLVEDLSPVQGIKGLEIYGP
jgi:internalin A